RIAPDLLEILAFEPLGRQLDRGQRVLDLVRDAPGHVAPGGRALRGKQLGDVVEGDDEAFGLAVDALGRDPHEQRAGAAAAGDLEFGLDKMPRAPARLAQERLHLGYRLVEQAADELLGARREQLAGRSVRKIDPAALIETDDACRDSGEHRLGETAPCVELTVRLDELAALLLELSGHAVEGAAQRADLV